MVFGFCKNKCKHEVYTKEEVDNLIANIVTTLNQYYTKEQVDNLMEDVSSSLNLGTIATHDYSRGTATPSGGSNGDIYDQYFE